MLCACVLINNHYHNFSPVPSLVGAQALLIYSEEMHQNSSWDYQANGNALQQETAERRWFLVHSWFIDVWVKILAVLMVPFHDIRIMLMQNKASDLQLQIPYLTIRLIKTNSFFVCFNEILLLLPSQFLETGFLCLMLLSLPFSVKLFCFTSFLFSNCFATVSNILINVREQTLCSSGF